MQFYMIAINNANYTYYSVLSSRARRKKILEGLNDIVGPNLRRDNVSMLDKLSEIFYREVESSKECACHNDPTGAEVHKLMAECLHDMSSTFEAIRE